MTNRELNFILLGAISAGIGILIALLIIFLEVF